MAKLVLTSNTSLPDSFVQDKAFREAADAMFAAGKEAAGTTTKCPILTSASIADHAEHEYAVMKGHGSHLANVMMEHCGGNPFAQVQSDVVTLRDKRPCLSHGTHYTCPKSHVPLVVASGFTKILDKKDATVADVMEGQASRFFQCSSHRMYNSHVSDGGAKGVVGCLNSLQHRPDMPWPCLADAFTVDGRTCMMHDTAKVVAFGGIYNFVLEHLYCLDMSIHV